MSGTACKEDYLALLKIAVGLIFREKLRYRAAYKRGQDLGLHACVAEDLRNINAIHDGSQHTDLVSLGSVDVLTGASSPEIAASGYDSHLDAAVH